MPNSSVNILPPAGRPQFDQATVQQLLAQNQLPLSGSYELLIVGVRGWFAKNGGTAAANARNVYDDALAVWAPSKGVFATFNGNTDPSRVRKGFGTAESTKGMAVLNVGIWPAYRFAKHGGSSPHEAICQRAGKVKVTRDGTQGNYEDEGNFGINIHRGGYYTTSSLGCQTLPPEQWGEFYQTAHDVAVALWPSAWRQQTVAYVLVNA